VKGLEDRLREGWLLLDAGMGTALIARGLQGRAPEWNLTHPGEVLEVHRSHVEAGAELVLTNTFAGASADEAAAALRLARESGAEFVAGSLWAGLADLGGQIARLAAADAIWIESATSAGQALRALEVANQVTSLPVVITCAMKRAPLEELRREGAAAAGYNCSPWPASVGGGVLKPDSAGLPPDEWALRVAELGGLAGMVGGCCGTSAEHLRALQRLRATAR
jgi:5-methyltetrahydrofolate--homocysteine methyltransferase